MAIRVRKFVDREFAKTVDLDLLRRFLAPYAARIGFEWSSLPAGEAEKRDAVFDLFKNADGRFPADLQFALFNISTLSSEAGARILQQHAEERNIELVSHEEIDGPQDARHLNPRHLALRAWLDHPMIFSRALDAVAFLSHSAKVERIGIRQGILPMNDDPKARTGFERAVSAHFSSRYQGRYCDVRWYREHDSVRALVLHGSKASTKNVDANGAEQSLTFREIVQDTIDYNISCGSISVGAKAAPDAKRLVALFAEYLLTDPEFFNHPDAGNIYSLAPINERGADFRFNFEWKAYPSESGLSRYGV